MNMNRWYKQEGTTGTFQSMLWARAVLNASRSHIGESWGEFRVYFKNNYLGVLWDEDALRRVSQKVLARSQNGLPPGWVTELNNIDRELTNASRSIFQCPVSTIPLSELHRLYDLVFELDQRMWNISIFIDTFDPGYDQEEIDRMKAKYGFTDHEAQVLLSPIEPSYLHEWNSALAQYQKGEVTLDYLKQQYFWIATDYFSFSELTPQFIQEASTHHHDDSWHSPLDEEADILTAHSLTYNPLELFRTLTQWRDIRKRLNYTGVYGLMRILHEVARRHGIQTTHLNGLYIEQVDEFFAGKLKEDTLRTQHQGGLLLVGKGDGSVSHVYGEAATNEWILLTKPTTQISPTEIRGTVASRGIAHGRVRIILDASSDMSPPMSPGDILVTSMTRPEFLPLMKLAAAIITNEGGITSHAAIVSRELKKPCIIGTKNATEALKDGDLVEVDANAGVVRKL